MKVLFYDVETGGVRPETHSLLSVGMCVFDVDTGEISDMDEMFVRLDSVEQYVISKGAFEIHGITAEYCMEHGHTIEEIRDRMLDMFVGCEMTGGHNAPSLDEPFIAHHILEGQAFRDTFGYRSIDSLTAVYLLAGTGFAAGATLTQAIKAFKIDMSDIKGKSHAALYDAVASARVSHHMRRLLVHAREQEKQGSLQIR